MLCSVNLVSTHIKFVPFPSPAPPYTYALKHEASSQSRLILSIPPPSLFLAWLDLNQLEFGSFNFGWRMLIFKCQSVCIVSPEWKRYTGYIHKVFACQTWTAGVNFHV